MIKQLKIKGGALQLTLFIIVMVALLLSMFLVFVFTYNHFRNQSSLIINTIKSSNEGVYYSLNTAIEQDTLVQNRIENDLNTELKIFESYWGAFQLVSSQANLKKFQFSKQALIGSVRPKDDQIAIYIENHNQPLVLVGNTKIKGVAYLSERGLKTGNISGESYFGDRLIYGSILESKHQLPELEKDFVHYLKGITGKYINYNERILNIESEKHHENSFSKPTEVFYEKKEIELSNVQLTGNIVVQSKTKITVRKESELRDVLLIAPEVYIAPGTSGNFHVVAGKQIIVGSQSELKYPTSLIVIRDTKREVDNVNSRKEPSIELHENTTIKGVIAYLNDESIEKDYDAHVLLNENVTIYGELYCEGNIQLNGHIYGSVFAKNTVVKKNGSNYQNHIYSTEVNRQSLPLQFAGLPFSDHKKGVALWLY